MPEAEDARPGPPQVPHEGPGSPRGPDAGQREAGVEEGRAGRGREGSPSLPGDRRRRGPAVAKEDALPGQGAAL